jgi:hypothetical protein
VSPGRGPEGVGPAAGGRAPDRPGGRGGVRAGAAGAALLVGLLLGGAPGAPALEGDLNPAGVQAAIDAGTASLTEDDFADEWRVPLPDGGEIVVTTPFSRLALAARQAAMKGEPLADKDRQEQIDRGKGRIQLLVTMFGQRRDFARWYQAAVRVGDREVKATFVQNERTPLRLPDGRFAARNVYVFPLEELPARGSVTLVVRGAPPAHEEVLRVPLDLGKFR